MNRTILYSEALDVKERTSTAYASRMTKNQYETLPGKILVITSCILNTDSALQFGSVLNAYNSDTFPENETRISMHQTTDKLSCPSVFTMIPQFAFSGENVVWWKNN